MKAGPLQIISTYVWLYLLNIYEKLNLIWIVMLYLIYLHYE